MGVAHHSAYVAWLEEARIEWLRAHGVSYRELEASGTMMPVTELNLRYRRPFRFDDTCQMRTTAAVSGRCSIIFTTELTADENDAVHAVGTVTVTAVDAHSRPIRLHEDLLQQLGLAS